MASRKQRRRRQKERRHEYEYVYVDEQGEEVEPPPGDEKAEQPGRGKTGRNGKGRGAGRSGRPLREYRPPSWNKSVRRSLLFFPLFFIVFSLVNRKAAIESRLLASLGYSILFIPLTYFMDRTAYRSYLRRTGRAQEVRRR
jgi:hypothetical protein